MVPQLPARQRLLVEKRIPSDPGLPEFGSESKFSQAPAAEKSLISPSQEGMNILGKGPPKMGITKPASPVLAMEQSVVDQPPPSMQHLFSTLGEFFYSFFIYWVNLACAEVLSWQKRAVKSPIDTGHRAVLVAQCGACSP